MRENMAEILIRGICQHMHSPREFATCRSIHNNLEIKKNDVKNKLFSLRVRLHFNKTYKLYIQNRLLLKWENSSA